MTIPYLKLDEDDARDAARYRWLRDRAPWTLISSNGITRLAARLPVQMKADADDANDMDAAIDAAMKPDPLAEYSRLSQEIAEPWDQSP